MCKYLHISLSSSSPALCESSHAAVSHLSRVTSSLRSPRIAGSAASHPAKIFIFPNLLIIAGPVVAWSSLNSSAGIPNWFAIIEFKASAREWGGETNEELISSNLWMKNTARNYLGNGKTFEEQKNNTITFIYLTYFETRSHIWLCDITTSNVEIPLMPSGGENINWSYSTIRVE